MQCSQRSPRENAGARAHSAKSAAPNQLPEDQAAPPHRVPPLQDHQDMALESDRAERGPN